MPSPSNRTHHIDEWFDEDPTGDKFANSLFVRIVAKKRRFASMDFKYTIFDTCYFRKCVFDSCDFTGCRFVRSNFHGSTFVGCRFDYSHFERTIIDEGILDTNCPGHENIKMRFARTLRMNFQQLGEAKAVNKAIRVELEATEVHLHKAWRSNESYYRQKYPGWRRIGALAEWLEFKFLDLLWGNGESPLKLLRATGLVLLLMFILDVIWFRDWRNISSYSQSIAEMPQVFLGALQAPHYPSAYATVILFSRLVTFGLFMSILIKRLNRR